MTWLKSRWTAAFLGAYFGIGLADAALWYFGTNTHPAWALFQVVGWPVWAVYIFTDWLPLVSWLPAEMFTVVD